MENKENSGTGKRTHTLLASGVLSAAHTAAPGEDDIHINVSLKKARLAMKFR